VEFKLNSTTFRGAVTIGYVVSDGVDTSAGVLTVTITNTLPVAVSNSISINAGDEPLVDVLGNDYDPDGTSLTLVGFSNVTGGTVTIEAGKLRVVPNTGSTQVTATYRIRDADGGEASGTLVVTVSVPPNTTIPPTTTTPPTTTPPPTEPPPTTVPPP
jgi:hypothetical protein